MATRHAAAEGATRPETLRQKDHRNLSTLERDCVTVHRRGQALRCQDRGATKGNNAFRRPFAIYGYGIYVKTARFNPGI